MNKKYYFLVLSFFLASLTYAENSVIRIGINAPLSGDLAEYGDAVKNGIRLAEIEDPSFVEKFKFFYEDN